MTEGGGHLAGPPAASLWAIDVDGAVRETLGRVQPTTRSQFLRRVGGVGAITLGTLGVGAGRAAAATKNDISILNFALALEYLQASFYTEAERLGALHGSLAEQAHVVGAHERAHVAAFRSQLGSAAIKEPRFDFHGVTSVPNSFRATAVAFEDLAVAAYKEQAPRIQSRSYLAAAIGIHSVEARHAAWIRRLAGYLPAANAFDEPLPDGKVVDIVNSTHFVTLATPEVSTRTQPRFTG